jgi:hypothetical protein
MKRAVVLLSLLLIACTGNGTRLPGIPLSTITCVDAANIGPDEDFNLGAPGSHVICDNNICFLNVSSPVCYYGCGPTQQDAGMFSPCWTPTPTPTPTPSPTP